MEHEELQSSELGTLEYWEERYRQEINNFRSNGDVGDIWFGEDILEKLLRWISSCAVIHKTAKIVDVGCGNGIMLVELARLGFENLLGVDYSEKAVVLAKEIASKENLTINYEVCDVLAGKLGENNFDVVLDKGTYDAVSLSPTAKEDKKKYVKNVHDCLRKDGLLVLTSCNWTREELDGQFYELFEFFYEIPTPQFKFGGKVGSVVTCVVYKRK